MSLKEELAEWVLKAHIPDNLGATWTKRLSNGEHYCIWAMSYAKEHGDTTSEWQSGYGAGIEAAINALEADAKLCDCAALEERECACGAWADYKTTTSARAVEIVRALKEQSK
jgi:hypothetical protein